MVVVTHEMGFAREVAHRMVFLHEGSLIEEGPRRAGDRSERPPPPPLPGGSALELLLKVSCVMHAGYQIREGVIAGAAATATRAARETLIRSKGTKMKTPCASAAAKGRSVTTESQAAPKT